MVVTCGSVTVEVIHGTVEVTLVPDEGLPATTSLNEGNSLTFEPTTFTITAPPTNVDTVKVVVEADTDTEATVNLSGGNGMIFDAETFTVTASSTNTGAIEVVVETNTTGEAMVATVSLSGGNSMVYDAETSLITAPSMNTDTIEVVIDGKETPVLPGEDIAIDPPRDIKARVIDNLSAHVGESKRVEKAIKEIEKSMDEKLWIDEIYLEAKHGKKVFDHEKHAVKELHHLVEHPKEVSEAALAAVQQAIDDLVTADRILVVTLINELSDTTSVDDKKQKHVNKELAKAQDELEKGNKERDADNPKPDKAIDHYKKAWEHATKAEDKVQAAPPAVVLPSDSLVQQNYPNPFNPETWIPYRLAKDVHVVIRIYNPSGRLVRRLDLGLKAAGFYTNRAKAAYWDGRDEYGETVSSGIYFYHLQAGGYYDTKKMVILK
ncbi:T9SS type A sorting domain-containing protein [Candidatus Poribacteria bacterium]|nr:T9SS type A sorting domain-containing protein [Candidatus Poribacteria bacterium]